MKVRYEERFGRPLKPSSEWHFEVKGAVRKALELVEGKHGFRTHTEIWRDCELTVTIGHNIYTTSIVISPPPMALVKRRGNWHNGHAYFCNGVFLANFSRTRVELI